MSTMYYTHPEKLPIGQVHFNGRGKGMHFIWCMRPFTFACWFAVTAGSHRAPTAVVDEYGKVMSLLAFQAIVNAATSQTLDERVHV